ncbi:hypothetical protein D3Z48_07815, partial [Clostridiaceae bacterium]|nr:hypothetical protein [Clostridiaceae bacterium]
RRRGVLAPDWRQGSALHPLLAGGASLRRTGGRALPCTRSSPEGHPRAGLAAGLCPAPAIFFVKKSSKNFISPAGGTKE